jgi:rhamnulokinase
MRTVAAVDLGASSGRVMLGRVAPGRLELTEAHRFPNTPVRLAGTLYTDIVALHRGMLTGLRAAGPVDGIGIDSWAVDYGLLDSSSRLLGLPVHYRDARTDGVADRVLATIGADELYAVTGLQQLPFNTLYQLVAEGPERLAVADRMLMIPDLLGFWLTGVAGAERTNASTTQLYDVRARGWSTTVAERAGIPSRVLPPLRSPGDIIGPVLPETELAAAPVIAVGSHDTASAVVAVPAGSERFAYISSGTWSLAGVELDAPVLTEAARAANFTNEGGVDGRIRFLKNVMGLWLLQESVRTWGPVDLSELLVQAAAAPAFAALIDPDDPSFLAPGDMPARIAEFCTATGQQVPPDRPALVRCILESLALAYRRTIRAAAELSGRDVEVVHIVGGGARNELLCQLTADACGLPVLAGPVEASALGNVLVQARALGVPLPDLAAMRALVRATHDLRRYDPRPAPGWTAAESRLTQGAHA